MLRALSSTPSLLRSPILWLAVACWPVVVWILERYIASPEERWHLVPALLLASAMWRRRGLPHGDGDPRIPRRSPLDHNPPGLAVVLLAVYLLSYAWLPPLLRALVVGCILATLISQRFWGRTLVPGVWGSVLLALPMLPSVHFFLGYPWRRWTTWAAAQLLQLGGLTVTAEGTQLAWPGGLVAVDAPCSGLDMGWVVAVLLVALWLFIDTGWRPSLLTAGATLGLVMMANALRASALFYLESGLLAGLPLQAQSWHHEAVGLAVFAPLCLLPGWFLMRSSATDGGAAAATPARPLVRRPDHGVEPRDRSGRRPTGRWIPSLWLAGLSLAFGLPWLVPAEAASSPDGGFPGWPSHYQGKELVQLPLTPREERFGEGFPGRLGRFHDGHREILLRWVAAPTRRLHPAAHCLRGHGYEVEHRPAERDGEGRLWTVLLAHNAQGSLRLREAIRDAEGRQWGDVSAWYWAALLGRSQGPWWSIVVAEGYQSEGSVGI